MLEAVSPARAGMVPSEASICSGAMGFPRASGDGPWTMWEISPMSSFPPRERGWSLVPLADAQPRQVSPARAGMVPDVISCCPLLPCFPRASGDGPGRLSSSAISSSFPPRERGWSQGSTPARHSGRVSPARAGMVPRRKIEPKACERFPRASGDGPYLANGGGWNISFPPRERGWSRPVGIRRREIQVSPARAGMVPLVSVSALASLGFPRASGDGPGDTQHFTQYLWFPPRERGWSPSARPRS